MTQNFSLKLQKPTDVYNFWKHTDSHFYTKRKVKEGHKEGRWVGHQTFFRINWLKHCLTVNNTPHLPNVFSIITII